MQSEQSSDNSGAVEIREHGEHQIVTLNGSLDMFSAPSVERSLASVFSSQRPSLVLDLKQVDIVDSSGIGALISWNKRLESSEGRLRLLNIPDSLAHIFKTARLDGRIEVLKNESEL
jgi:anti-anti-sigma factor